MRCVVCNSGKEFKGVGGLYKHYCKVHYVAERGGRGMTKFKCFVRDCMVVPV